jgi:hypothetical protein
MTLNSTVAVAGSTPTLTLNDGGVATYTGGTGTETLTFSYTVAAGDNTPDLAVSAVNLNGATVTDAAGNAADLSGALGSLPGTLQIDTAAPTPPTIDGDTLNVDNSVALSGTAAPGSTVTVFDGTTQLGTTTAAADTTWTFRTPPLDPGANSFVATATDAAGNVSTPSAAVGVITSQAPPSISATSSGTEIDVTNLAFVAPAILGWNPVDAGNSDAGLGFTPNSDNAGGTLSVTQGSETVNIALLGSYMASTFVATGDGNGGTLVNAFSTTIPNAALLTPPGH